MKCIFLVEDNKDNADLIRDILAGEHVIVSFTTADAALAALKDRNTLHPDLLLLDISLPGRDGVELLQLIRQQYAYRDTPAIALTAHAMSSDRERFLGAGFNSYVSKPIMEEEVLLDAINNLLYPTSHATGD